MAADLIGNGLVGHDLYPRMPMAVSVLMSSLLAHPPSLGGQLIVLSAKDCM